MGGKVKALGRENDDLKRQLNDLKKECLSIKFQTLNSSEFIF